MFQFPKQKIVFGPRQIVGRINQDQVISPQITLWDQQGSQVIWGTLLVIPIEESLLYIRPLYLRSPEGRIPELKRVIVAYQNRIVMAETLPLALAQIFGQGVLGTLAADDPFSLSRAPAAAAPPGAPQAPAPATAEPGASVDAALAALAAEADGHFRRADQALRDGNLALYAEEIQRAREVVQRMLAIRR